MNDHLKAINVRDIIFRLEKEDKLESFKIMDEMKSAIKSIQLLINKNMFDIFYDFDSSILTLKNYEGRTIVSYNKRLEINDQFDELITIIESEHVRNIIRE